MTYKLDLIRLISEEVPRIPTYPKVTSTWTPYGFCKTQKTAKKNDDAEKTIVINSLETRLARKSTRKKTAAQI